MHSITGKTQLLGIFGDPVSHSLSPAMQNAALAAAGIDAVYLPFHIHPDQLKSAVESIRMLNLVGINVTVPHKETIMSYLDEIDPAAALIGAVNTVVNRQGRLIGFNTDGPGFLASLRQDLQLDPLGKRVVVLGAGGACRAALCALAGNGAKSVVLANRTQQTAEALACEMTTHFLTTEIEAVSLTEPALSDHLQRADLLVNTTSVGLAGESFPAFLVDRLAADAAIYDMVYVSGFTPLLESAHQRGLACADGRGMLIAQGETAFTKWFGVQPLAGVMRSHVVEK